MWSRVSRPMASASRFVSTTYKRHFHIFVGNSRTDYSLAFVNLLRRPSARCLVITIAREITRLVPYGRKTGRKSLRVESRTYPRYGGLWRMKWSRAPSHMRFTTKRRTGRLVLTSRRMESAWCMRRT